MKQPWRYSLIATFLLLTLIVGCPSYHKGILTAAFNGNDKVIEDLLRHGVNVEINDKGSGNTALHYASAQGHDQAVKVLLDHHANIDSMNRNQETPLSMAIDNKRTGTALLLLKRGASPKLRARQNYSPLFLAVHSNDVTVTEQLLTSGADPNLVETTLQNASEQKSVTSKIFPIHYAAMQGNEALVNTLLNHGAKIDQALPNEVIELPTPFSSSFAVL